MQRILILSVFCLLTACKSGDPLPPAAADRQEITLLFVMNCVQAANIRTYYDLEDEKRKFPTERYDYWINVKAQLFNKNVERNALQRMERASIAQSAHDAKLNLSRQEKIKKYRPILERCAERERPLDEMKFDYESELL